MAARDTHSALKSEVIKKANAGHLELVLVRQQWGKDDTAFSLHANPSSYTTAGLQTTDFLGFLGFSRSDRCPFTSFQRCYSRPVDQDFSIENFATAFNTGYGLLSKAEHLLQSCGFSLPQSEGWGFFFGKQGGSSRRGPTSISGDGHTGIKTDSMKQSEDDKFLFRFSFLDTGGDKAFVTHYRPKHLPMSAEISSILRYLGLKEFDSCPEFDFESCFYRAVRFEPRDDNMSGGNVDWAHQAFGAHANNFSPAIESLLAANAVIEEVGLTFLPIPKPSVRNRTDIVNLIARPKPKKPLPSPTMAFDAALPDNFDVAFSFAGSERELAKQLAEKLQAAGFAVFYDNFYPEHLWGKNLTAFLDEIYRKRAKFCVVFVSKEYKERRWTNHEMRSAQARALELKGEDYILPIRIDDTELEGLPPTVGYVDIKLGIEAINELLVKKLRP